ncbi:MAG: DUF6348 family protein [Isosphaeraceae bacterium]
MSDAKTPTISKANPGIGVKGRVELARGAETWSEALDLVQSMVRVMEQQGHSAVPHETWLELPDPGLVIQPQLVEFYVLKDGGVRTVTTVEASHPEVFPGGIFEFQHATGNNMEASVDRGFEQWSQIDLVTLLDALRPKPQSCTMMQMSLPATDERPARLRRAVLGPVGHLRANPTAVTHESCPTQPGEAGTGDDDHPFCSCCFLTRSIAAFKSLIEGDGFRAIRFFAARGVDGSPMADCRINGEDWEPGAQALREYVKTWPGVGYELRKQYVVLQTIPGEWGTPG